MPHDHSWFSVLLGSLYAKLEHALSYLGSPFGQEGGHTWVAHEHIGAQHVVAAIFVFLLLLVVGLIVSSRLKDAKAAIIPEDTLTVRTAIELIVGATYKMMTDMMGAKAARHFLPLIGTLAFFILISNLLGLVPGFLPPTDKLNTTLACSSVVLVATQVYGVKEHGLGGWIAHFFGPLRNWYAIPIMLMMLGIELFTHFAVRPGSLAVRLMANMTADHLVLMTFHEMVPWLVPLPMYLLGLLVSIVQTLVFCLLSTVYIAMAIAHEEH